MNDRLNFRVWFNGRFVYKSLCDSNVYTEDGKCICLANTLPANLPWEQCTGLKDKNGRLIYEGDIVKRLFFNDRRKNKMKNCVVKWCDGRAVFILDADMRDDYRSYEAYCDNVFKECEVIGNIHENPELVEALK